ncbi:MAG: putative bifunctional diguanylate cyclase/phosphodiesterase [Cyanophyceae cyanobacterium]
MLIVVIYGITGLALEQLASVFSTSWEVSPWYPPAALHMVLLLGFGWRYTPALLIVPVIDGLVIERLVAPQKAVAPLYVGICALGIMAFYSAACTVLQHQLKIDPRLYRSRDVMWFTIVAAIASFGVAVVCVTALALEGQVAWSMWREKVLHYWAGDATGIAMLAPPLLILLRSAPWVGSRIDMEALTLRVNWRLPTGEQVLKWGIAIAALLVTSWAAYGGIQSENLDYTYFIFLPLIWIAVQQGFEKAAIAILIINFSSVIFVGSRASDADSLALQFGLMAVSFSGILLGIVVNDRLLELTQRQQTEQQLLYDATHDSLTSLHNRAWFMEQLNQKIAQNSDFALLFLDLDRFKLVNDSLGHSIGDRLLVMIAARLKNSLLSQDLVARFGGDEFIILLEGMGVRGATRFAKRLGEELAQTIFIDEYQVFTTVSIGIVAKSSAESVQAENLIRNVDIAMYRAKAQGSGRYAVFDEAMYRQLIVRSQLEQDLRQALFSQLQLYYQPIVSLETGRITSFEALLRWQHPDRGIISPMDFIPIAEDTGMIVAIGEWVLEETCQQMRLWQHAYPQLSLSISVNLSGYQLIQPGLIERIEEILQVTNFDARTLKLEITESAVMNNAQDAATILRLLTLKGIELAIDDFGTGYSSLSRLAEFNVHTLKIDRSFISLIGRSEKRAAIIRATIMLAHSLGMSVTAEGVETAAQLSALRTLRCEEAQGYYFSRPLTREAAHSLLLTEPQW